MGLRAGVAEGRSRGAQSLQVSERKATNTEPRAVITIGQRKLAVDLANALHDGEPQTGTGHRRAVSAVDRCRTRQGSAGEIRGPESVIRSTRVPQRRHFNEGLAYRGLPVLASLSMAGSGRWSYHSGHLERGQAIRRQRR